MEMTIIQRNILSYLIKKNVKCESKSFETGTVVIIYDDDGKRRFSIVDTHKRSGNVLFINHDIVFDDTECDEDQAIDLIYKYCFDGDFRCGRILLVD